MRSFDSLINSILLVHAGFIIVNFLIIFTVLDQFNFH